MRCVALSKSANVLILWDVLEEESTAPTANNDNDNDHKNNQL